MDTSFALYISVTMSCRQPAVIVRSISYKTFFTKFKDLYTQAIFYSDTLSKQDFTLNIHPMNVQSNIYLRCFGETAQYSTFPDMIKTLIIPRSVISTYWSCETD